MAREMKDSGIEWIGEIPLKYIASCNDEILSEDTNPDTQFEYIEIGDVSYEQGISGSKLLSFKDAPSRARRIVKKDDIIVSTVRTYLKAVASIPKKYEGQIVSTGFAVIRPKNIDSRFLLYCLLSDNFVSEIESRSTGVSYPAINSSDVMRIKIKVPTNTWQTLIASFLDSKCAEIDKAVEATKASIEEYKKLRQAIITEAVTKGLDPTVEMKDSGCEELGKIPKTYEILSLSKKVSLYGRIGFRGYTTSDLVEEGEGAITLSPGNILDNGKLVFDHCSYLSWYKYDESPEIKVKNGDILLVKTGSSYGKSGIVEELPLETTVNPQLIVIKDFNCINKWLFYFMQTAYFKSCCESIVGGGTIPTMSQQKIAKTKIAVPYRMEQMQITKYLDSKCSEIDSLIKSKEKLIEELTAYRKSLIYEYVTGKKEVPAV